MRLSNAFSHVSFDVIAVGDTTEDVFLEMSDAKVACGPDGRDCRLSFAFAEKIAVDKKTDVAAVGNAANHAIGAARLGLKTAIYTVVGDDVQGHIAQDVFRENGVDTRYVEFDQEHGTNFSTVINFQSERTIFVFHEPRRYRLPALASAKWMYLTSVSGGGVEVLHEQALKWLKENESVRLAFNPGTYQLRLGLEGLKPLLQRTQLLFLNREETAGLLGLPPDGTEKLMAGCHELGVKMMVLTDGPKGSYVSDGDSRWHLKIFDGPVVERTGAGDSYGAAFLSALIKGKTVAEAMLWGNANSTSVVQFIGAREGLLDVAGIRRLIDANIGVKPEKMI